MKNAPSISLLPFFNMIRIVIGLCIMFALPLFIEGRVRRKHDRKAIRTACRITGGAIVLWGIVSYII